jgi:hypothetical protein
MSPRDRVLSAMNFHNIRAGSPVAHVLRHIEEARKG